jgi:hypothetical protein
MTIDIDPIDHAIVINNDHAAWSLRLHVRSHSVSKKCVSTGQRVAIITVVTTDIIRLL